MRRLIAFRSKGGTLVGSLDEAEGRTGVLIVSGGNEVRAGAHRGIAALAGELAADGVPVFRFDRTGVGDSEGANIGNLRSMRDIERASVAFTKAQPQVTRIVGFGNCDAASALALFGYGSGADAAVLANPWLGEEPDDLPPAAAIRARLAGKIVDLEAWGKLLRADFDADKFMRGLKKAVRPRRSEPLAERVLAGVAAWGRGATVVLARGDATAIRFAAAAKGRSFRTETIDTASHSFAGDAVRAALRRILLAAVAREEDAD